MEPELGLRKPELDLDTDDLHIDITASLRKVVVASI